ncbi:protein with role in RNA processing [Coelomomyces lativittatus]|nr:protein with role in RNA processing [Coelomomyces lativittatus]
MNTALLHRTREHPMAESVFQALSKTMVCRWDNATIWVMDCVRVFPPYTIEQCHGNDPVALERVRKVLQGERQRLEATAST